MRRTTVASIVILLAATPLLAGTPIDRTLAASADGVVTVSNISGSVEIRGWERNEVQVSGTLGAGAEELEFERDGNEISIAVKIPRRARNVGRSDLVISVPKRSSLEVETVSAWITVEKIQGAVELMSVSGDITVEDRPAALELSSVSGRVKAEHISGSSEISAVSGSVELFDGEGSVELSSVSGDIVVHGGTLDRLEAATTSGSIHCEAVPSDHGTFEFESMSGNLVLVVPKSLGADYELSTFSGNIKNQIGPKPERTSKYAPGEKAEFSIGDGSAQVTMSSFSGWVKLLVE